LLKLIISNLSHSFDEREVFKSINFAFDGARLAVTGQNGSGKSTLLKIMTGLLTPTGGEFAFEIDGVKLDHDSIRDFAGLAAPDINLYNELTVRENLRFLAAARGCKCNISNVLSEVGLLDRENDPIGDLSTGLRRRACIAAALLHDPSILLLDEPSTNLDENGIEMLHEVIERQSQKGIVVLATNDPNEAALCDERLGLGACK
jgi:heme exporter protein A